MWALAWYIHIFTRDAWPSIRNPKATGTEAWLKNLGVCFLVPHTLARTLLRLSPNLYATGGPDHERHCLRQLQEGSSSLGFSGFRVLGFTLRVQFGFLGFTLRVQFGFLGFTFRV